MKWTKLTLSTMADALDLVSNMLNELGIDGIEIIDNVPITENERKAMFIDILPELDEDDKTATISFYLEENQDVGETITQIQDGLEELKSFTDVGSGKIEISETEDVDWINNWKEFFKPFRVDDTIVIKPTWEPLLDISENDLVIEIDPGTAFGTGAHETTKLCILGIKKYIKPGIKLLDVGSGSGILSIIGAKLGASVVLGTDIDPNAVTAALENVEVNHISSDIVNILSGDIITDEAFQQKVGLGCYDMVVANILADVIIPLSAEIGKHLKEDGIFISSGIINTKKEQVKEAILKNGFRIIEIKEMGDWVSIVAQK
ncbi:MAG: ribosomal protein methyltransferase [Anaerocolumna sp.]|nr:ribosomal protein methyltransferase [Anaerocolumna sp.]